LLETASGWGADMSAVSSTPGRGEARPPGSDSGRLDAIPDRVVSFRMRSVLGVLALLLGVAAAVEFVVLAQAALTLIAIALFLALALNPGVAFFERRGVRRGTAVGAVYVLALLALALLGLVLVPPLIDQVTKFVDALPGLVADLTEGHGKLGFLERDYHVVERVRDATSGNGTPVEGAAAPVFSLAKGVATTVIGAILIAFLTLFMLLEGPDWRERIDELVPERRRASIERIGAGVYKGVSGFVIGNLLASFLAGVFVTVVFLVLGVPYAIPVGLFVALIEVVPYIGPLVATVVATGVALTEGVAPGLIVLGLLLVYHLVEGHTLRPLIYGRALKLSPLAVLIAILLGIEVAGVLGALVAVPLAGSIQVVIAELLQPHRHGASGRVTG
jgi:predicted PurR-regulated permease PerM